MSWNPFLHRCRMYARYLLTPPRLSLILADSLSHSLTLTLSCSSNAIPGRPAEAVDEWRNNELWVSDGSQPICKEESWGSLLSPRHAVGHRFLVRDGWMARSREDQVPTHQRYFLTSGRRNQAKKRGLMVV